MSPFIECVVYLAVIGSLFFVIGRILPKRWFCYDKFPYRSSWPEKENSVYLSLGVRKWKDKLPDMCAILPDVMPAKKLPKLITAKQMKLMIQETCVAESVHGLLSLLGFGCVFIWKAAGGWLISLLYTLGNLPYIIIQRHNRPKLLRLLKKLRKKEFGVVAKEREIIYEDGSAVELQHGAGA